MLAERPSDRPASAEAAWEELEHSVARLHGALWRRDAHGGWAFSPKAETSTAITEAGSRESVIYTPTRNWRRDFALSAALLVATIALLRIVLAHARRNSAS